MREADLYAPIIRGAHKVGVTLWHPQESSGKAPFDLAGIVSMTQSLVPKSKDEPTVMAFGLAVAAEVKLVKAPPRIEGEPIPWRDFRPHQVTYLKEYAKAGGLSLAMIYYEAVADLVCYVLKGEEDFLLDLPSTCLRHTHMKSVSGVEPLPYYEGWERIALLWATIHSTRSGPDGF